MARRLYDATWGRVFAAGYDRFLAATERAGLRERRRQLLAGAEGRTLELGAGTGLNLEHYPDAMQELVLSEPDSHMVARLRQRVARSGRPAEVVQAPGERVPFDDASFDTVAFTMVLCTAADPPAVLAEVARVLRPGGRLLFFEHVRSEEPRLARWQDRLEGPWSWFGHGCHCNRRTAELLYASPLEVERLERGTIRAAVPLVRPLLVGAARRSAAST